MNGKKQNNVWRRVICKLIKLGMISSLVVVIVFSLGLFFIPGDLLEGVSGLATVALVVGGLIFTFVEYSKSEVDEERKNAETRFNLYQGIFDRLMSLGEIEARRWIIKNIPLYDPEQSKEEWVSQVRGIIFNKSLTGGGGITPGHQYIKQVLNSFDNLGFVMENYWDLDPALQDWLAPPIAKIWQRIGPYIEEEAQRRQEPDYYDYARRLGESSVKWRNSMDLPQPKFVEDAL